MGLTSARKLAPRGASAPPPGQMPLDSIPQAPEEVARATTEALDARGWCLWKCSTFDGDVIVIMDPYSARGAPTGYPVYTTEELRLLGQLHSKTIRLVHEAKRIAGATIESVEVSG